MNNKKTLLICLGILLIGAVVTYIIFQTEPTASRSGATKETAMLVDVTEVKRGTFRPTIVATGTVQPSQDIILSARVSGEITSIAPGFVPGGFVQKGQTLLQIDPADYQNTLQLRKSDLSQAQADLNIEKGRQEVARMDYELIGDTLAEEDEYLVLRQPQLEAVQARVEAAQAAIEQAELQLQRTTIKAPFDAQIISRNANVGSQVAPGNDLGRLVGVNEYWVVVNVPLSQLRWLRFPEGDRARGAEVKIRNRTAWPEGEFRRGYLYKLVGALDAQTRLARVLVTVPDPLAYGTAKAGEPPLMIGAFVEANIQAEEIPDVIRLNRDYIRQDDTVWIMEDGKLRIRDAEIIFRDAEYAYVTSGLDEDDRIVMTNLTTVVDGASLRLEESEAATGQDSLSLTAQ